MAVIRFDKEHKMGVEESVQEVHDKIVSAGAAYTPLIQVRVVGDEQNLATVNAHAIRAITHY